MNLKEEKSVNTEVRNLVDFHTHLLPGIDDGSSSIETTLAMLEAAAEQGIGAMIATPHFYPEEESPQFFLKRRRAACSQLLTVYDPNIHPAVYLGAEVAFFSGIGHSRIIRELAVLGTDVILVEMPFSEWTASTVEEIYFLRESLGLIPVIAHVERYAKYQKRGTLKKLIANGALIQSNANYFIDPKNSKKALKQFRHGDINVLGSDTHNMTSRPQNLKQAVSLIAENGGGKELERMDMLGKFLLENAIRIDLQ